MAEAPMKHIRAHPVSKIWVEAHKDMDLLLWFRQLRLFILEERSGVFAEK
jgi:hypothetical protein